MVDSWICGGKILIFKALFYKEKNTKLKFDMTNEKQQFCSDALFYNQLQKNLDFC